MKTVLLCFLLSFCTNDPNEPQRTKPKWDDYDKWRKNLRVEMSEAGVEGLLGKPLYKKESSSEAVWYYQYMPKILDKPNRDKKLIEYSEIGIVEFYNSISSLKNTAPIYKVISWTEPDWEALKNGNFDTPEPVKKLKPIRKLLPYEKKESWRKLRFGMQTQTIRRILGEPTRIVGDMYSAEIFFIYAFKLETIQLKFRKDELYEWSEPYWPAIEKELYKEIENEK